MISDREVYAMWGVSFLVEVANLAANLISAHRARMEKRAEEKKNRQRQTRLKN